MNDDINNKVATYESHLREAEHNIEDALKSICSLRGSKELNDIRKSLKDALGLVQYNICGTFKLYDNPDINICA